MEARKVEKSPEDETYVDYKDFMRELFATSASRPSAAFVLKKLLERYIANSKTSYTAIGLSYKSRSFSHTKDAADLIGTLEQENGLTDALTTIGTKFSDSFTKGTIFKGTEFGLVLTPFFRAYPEFIHYLQNEEARQVAMNEALLCPGAKAYADWQTSFQQNHLDGACSDNHEVLSLYAEQIPPSMAGSYATFLLKQVFSNGKFPNEAEESSARPEEYPGIYAGRVCVALSKLASKLDPRQKKEVCGFLVKALDKFDLNNIANIGICLALSTLGTDAETKTKTVDRLHKFLGEQLRNKQNGVDLDIEFQSSLESVRTYMPLLFQAMLNMNDDSRKISKAQVFEILLDAQYLYAYREGLSILFDWMEADDLQKLHHMLCHENASGINEHPKFGEVVTLLWQRMRSKQQNAENAGPVNRAYSRHYQAAIAQLTTPNADTNWTGCLALACTSESWKQDAVTNASKFSQLVKNAVTIYPKTHKEHLITEILGGLPSLLPFMMSNDKLGICNCIRDHLLPLHCSNLELNVIGLRAILLFKSSLTESEWDNHFNDLLALLKQEHNKMRLYNEGKPVKMPSARLITEMLTIAANYAAQFPAAKIPAFMMYIESLGVTKDVIIDERVHLVLGDILKSYPAKAKEFFSQMAPVPAPVVNTPKLTGSSDPSK